MQGRIWPLPGALSDVLSGLITGQISVGDLLSVLGGNSTQFGPLFSQVLQDSSPCRTSPAIADANSISALGAPASRAYTLAGLPRVTVNLRHIGPDALKTMQREEVVPWSMAAMKVTGTVCHARRFAGV